MREILNSERFVDLAPRQVYAALLDEGHYLCHWRTMYRILQAHDEVCERRNQRRHPTSINRRAWAKQIWLNLPNRLLVRSTPTVKMHFSLAS